MQIRDQLHTVVITGSYGLVLSAKLPGGNVVSGYLLLFGSAWYCEKPEMAIERKRPMSPITTLGGAMKV